MWKTTDGGATWQHLGLDLTVDIGRIVIDPKNPNNVFVAAMGNLFTHNVDRGVYRSQNGGLTWTKVLFDSGTTWTRQSVTNLASIIGARGFWSGRLFVHPTNPNDLPEEATHRGDRHFRGARGTLAILSCAPRRRREDPATRTGDRTRARPRSRSCAAASDAVAHSVRSASTGRILAA